MMPVKADLAICGSIIGVSGYCCFHVLNHKLDFRVLVYKPVTYDVMTINLHLK